MSLADDSRRRGGPGKVVLVAHSMGGLAIRCALSSACGGRGGNDVASRVEEVVTFDTPNNGTFLKESRTAVTAWEAVAPALSFACQASQRVVAYSIRGMLCKAIKAFGTSDAAHAFTPGPRSCGHWTAMHPGRARCPSVAVAGKIEVTTHLFTAKFTLGDIGDAVVSTESAHAGAGSRTKTIDCGALDVARVGSVGLADDFVNCVHTTEPKDPRFLDVAARVIRNAGVGPYRTRSGSTASARCGSVSSPPTWPREVTSTKATSTRAPTPNASAIARTARD